MEYTFVSSHTGNTCSEHMQSSKVLYIHTGLLNTVGCDVKEQFASCLLELHTNSDWFMEMKLQGYARYHGNGIVRHKRSKCIGYFDFTSENIITTVNSHISLTKISHLTWDTLEHSWSLLSAYLLLKSIMHRKIQRHDIMCIAIPSNTIKQLDDSIMLLLKQFCEHNINVGYPLQSSRTTYIKRSFIVPLSFLEQYEFETSIYSMITDTSFLYTKYISQELTDRFSFHTNSSVSYFLTETLCCQDLLELTLTTPGTQKKCNFHEGCLAALRLEKYITICLFI